MLLMNVYGVDYVCNQTVGLIVTLLSRYTCTVGMGSYMHAIVLVMWLL